MAIGIFPWQSRACPCTAVRGMSLAVRPTVYLETTIPSYLTARPSNDLAKAARQAATRLWWDTQRSKYACFVSQLIWDEVGRGDPEAARLRLEVLDGISRHDLSDETPSCTATALPQGAARACLGRCPPHCRERRSPDGVHSDLEFPAYRECPHDEDHPKGLRRSRSSLSGNLHAGSTAGGNPMKPKDDVMKEVHRIKDEIAREHGYDLQSLFEAARKRQAETAKPKPKKSGKAA